MAISPSELRAQSMGASPEVQLDEDDALLYDAEIYAKNQGVSVDEALYRFHIQDVAGELDAKLTENETDTFAGLWIEHAPEFKVVVLFTEDGEKSIEPYLTEELNDIAEVRPAQRSLEKLQNAQKEMVLSLWDMEIPVESEINVYENNVKIFVAEANRADLDSAVQEELITIPDYIKLITVPELGKPTENIHGGLPLSACNTAFSVQHSSGTRGVTTAAHCSEGNTNLIYSGTILPIAGKLYTGSYDVEWHLTPGFTVTNEFKSGTYDIRRVTGIKSRDNQAVGNYVCKYGSVTGYTCGCISSKDYRPSYVPNSVATFIRVDNGCGYTHLVSQGDSGGPVFNGYTAYGIVSGIPGSDPNDAIYIAINYITGLGVSVVTAPVFADVPWDYWAWENIERLYNSDITGGCYTDPSRYCPSNTVTRAEMAVFLLRGIHGASYTPPPIGSSTGFNDVPTSYWAAAWIKQLAAEGITGGCYVGYYCPEGTATHAQMAVFLLRSKYTSAYTPPPVGSSTGFNDVPTSYWAAAWIKQMRLEGISNNQELINDGCPSGSFCPEASVTRALMAGLLVRTFNLP